MAELTRVIFQKRADLNLEYASLYELRETEKNKNRYLRQKSDMMHMFVDGEREMWTGVDEIEEDQKFIFLRVISERSFIIIS